MESSPSMNLVRRADFRAARLHQQRNLRRLGAIGRVKGRDGSAQVGGVETLARIDEEFGLLPWPQHDGELGTVHRGGFRAGIPWTGPNQGGPGSRRPGLLTKDGSPMARHPGSAYAGRHTAGRDSRSRRRCRRNNRRECPRPCAARASISRWCRSRRRHCPRRPRRWSGSERPSCRRCLAGRRECRRSANSSRRGFRPGTGEIIIPSMLRLKAENRAAVELPELIAEQRLG